MLEKATKNDRAIIVNIIVVALLLTLNMFIPDNRYFLVGVFCLMVITSSALLYQIIKKFRVVKKLMKMKKTDYM